MVYWVTILFIGEESIHKDTKTNTPNYDDNDKSTIQMISNTLVGKSSTRDDIASTNNNENYISGKTGIDNPTTESKKSWKKRRNHHKHNKKTNLKNLLPPQDDDENNKSGNISDLGAHIMKEFQKFNNNTKEHPGAPSEYSLENEANNTSQDIDITTKKRRSNTGDQIKGLGLKSMWYDNFIAEHEESPHLAHLV
jgi:hypothetical protein